jgi:hypothetical protein
MVSNAFVFAFGPASFPAPVGYPFPMFDRRWDGGKTGNFSRVKLPAGGIAGVVGRDSRRIEVVTC